MIWLNNTGQETPSCVFTDRARAYVPFGMNITERSFIMKRYFDFPESHECVKIEAAYNSVLGSMSIEELFGDRHEVIKELTKKEYIVVEQKYKRENVTNLTLTITR